MFSHKLVFKGKIILTAVVIGFLLMFVTPVSIFAKKLPTRVGKIDPQKLLEEAQFSLQKYQSFAVIDKTSSNLANEPYVTKYFTKLRKNDLNFKIVSFDPNLASLFKLQTLNQNSNSEMAFIGVNIFKNPELFVSSIGDKYYQLDKNTSKEWGLLLLTGLDITNSLIFAPVRNSVVEQKISASAVSSERITFAQIKNNIRNPFFGLDLNKFQFAGFTKKGNKTYARYRNKKDLKLNFDNDNLVFNRFEAEILIEKKKKLVEEIAIDTEYQFGSPLTDELREYLSVLSKSGNIKVNFVRKFSNFNSTPKIIKPPVSKIDKTNLLLFNNSPEYDKPQTEVPVGLFIENNIDNLVFAEKLESGSDKKFKSYLASYVDLKTRTTYEVAIMIFPTETKAFEYLKNSPELLTANPPLTSKSNKNIIQDVNEYSHRHIWISNKFIIIIGSILSASLQTSLPLVNAYLQKYPNDLTDKEITKILQK